MLKSPILSAEHAKQIYDELGVKQDSQAYYEDPAFDRLIANGAFGTAKSVLEFGCGTGRLAERLLIDYMRQEAAYMAVDISPVMVRITQDRLAALSNRATVLHTDGSMLLPIGDNHIDRFLCTYVIDLLSNDDARQLINEARRALKPSGLLCVASLAKGRGNLPRLISLIWTAIYRLVPHRVGGCRPVSLMPLLEEGSWRVTYHDHVAPYGIASEILIAERS